MITLPGHQSSAYMSALAYSPDGRSLATGGAGDNAIRVWDLATGGERLVATTKRMPMPLNGVAWSLDGTKILSTGYPPSNATRTVEVWDAQSGALQETIHRGQSEFNLLDLMGRPITPHSESQRLRLAEATGWLVSRACAQRVFVQPRSRSLLHTTEGFPVRAQMRKIRLKSERRYDYLLLPQTAQGTALGTYVPGLAYSQSRSIHRMAFSPDEQVLALVEGCRIELWDAEKWGRIRELSGPHEEHDSEGYGRSVNSLAFSPDGRMLVSGDSLGTVCLWTLAEPCDPLNFEWGIGGINAVAFAPDGTTVAAAGNKQIVVWDVDGDSWA